MEWLILTIGQLLLSGGLVLQSVTTRRMIRTMKSQQEVIDILVTIVKT